MKAFLQRYLNEVVGLTVLFLMAAALIAGQVGAGVAQLEEQSASMEIRLTVAE